MPQVYCTWLQEAKKKKISPIIIRNHCIRILIFQIKSQDLFISVETLLSKNTSCLLIEINHETVPNASESY